MKDTRPNVVLISIDALKPEFVFEQERLGISLPNLHNYFVREGTVAKEGITSVFPPFTYPCHQSMITGTNPAVHGIYNNGIFDPMGNHKGAWHWFVSDQVENLWEVAHAHGYLSASVAFPTSVGAKGDFIAPEYWWDGSGLDSKFIDAMACPQGLVLEMEQSIGQYAGGLDLTDQGDAQRFRGAMWLLEEKCFPILQEKPFFLSTYFASFDESAHIYGVYSKEAAASLEKIDAMVGELVERVMKATGGNAVISVASDHGTLDNEYNICPNVLLQQAGLISLGAQKEVLDWSAWSQRTGGIAELRLKDDSDLVAKEKLARLVLSLPQNPASGILEVLNREEAIARGGFPLATWVLVAKKGYEFRDDVVGDYCRTTLTQKAQHGYSEQFQEMRASFLITGKNIAQGGTVKEMKLIDIAPTLAAIMGFALPQAQGQNRL